MKQIEFKQVNKIFAPNVMALEDASFEIEQGEFVFVIGKSGAGKSTLLKLLSRQMLPTSGEIWVNGHEVNQIKKSQRPYFQRQFGIMETEVGLLSDQTVYQNIHFVMRATEQPRKLSRIRVTQTLHTVGLSHRAQAFPKELSVGEAAKALFARAIVMNPKILIADEPTANLDPDASYDLMRLLEELNRLGVTIIVASHSRELVTIMKKRVITLVAGAVVADQKKAIYNPLALDIFEERRVLNEREQNQKL